MNKNFYKIILVSFFITFVFFNGCSEDATQSLWPPPPSGDPPVVNSIEPSDEGLAGVTEIIINGANFTSETTHLMVYFNSVQANILQASENQIRVTAPNIVSDSIEIKVSVVGAELFSTPVMYRLKPAITELKKPDGTFIFNNPNLDNISPFGVTTDAQGNVYVSITSSGVSTGIKKISPAGELSDWAPKGVDLPWVALKIGPGDTIYAARNLRGVWKIVQGQQPESSPWAVTPSATRIVDLDFDSNLNIWGVGTAIYRITQNNDVKTFNFSGTLRSVRYFDGYLFIAGNINNSESVWRIPVINSDSIGLPELYFDYVQVTSEVIQINAITFADNGDLVIGVESIGTQALANPILIVRTDKSFYPLYPDVFDQHMDVRNFAWGPDNFLYFTRPAYTAGTNVILTPNVIKVDMERLGATHYGR
jgi:hypothetical protein